MSVVLDAGSKSLHAVITSGLVLTSDSTIVGVARADTRQFTGRFVFEVNRTILSFSTCNVGLTSLATPDNTGVGAFYIDRDGLIFLNGVFIGTFTAGTDNVLFAVDMDLKKVWLQSGVGWSGAGNPCTPTGGFDISSITASGLYPYGAVGERTFGAPDSSVLTFDFGGTTVVNTGPACSGWVMWDGGPVGPRTSAIVNARMRAFRNTFTGKSHGHNIIGSPSMAQAVIAATEPSDVCAMVVGNTVAGTLAETEPSDVCSMIAYVRDIPGVLDDGDRTYVPAEYPTIVPSVASSRFVIPSEDTVEGGL